MLAFSPGENFYDFLVRDEAIGVRCPIFVAAESDSNAVNSTEQLLGAVPAAIRVLSRLRHASHGATMLRREINPRGGAENWAAVLEFLALLPEEPPA